MELSQLQRRAILKAWRAYQDAVGAARQQTHQAIDVLRGQAQQQAAGADGGTAQAAAEVCTSAARRIDVRLRLLSSGTQASRQARSHSAALPPARPLACCRAFLKHLKRQHRWQHCPTTRAPLRCKCS